MLVVNWRTSPIDRSMSAIDQSMLVVNWRTSPIDRSMSAIDQSLLTIDRRTKGRLDRRGALGSMGSSGLSPARGVILPVPCWRAAASAPEVEDGN